ncbi:hypothetical protein WMY93_002419 [Mugilogobius chulae]|uniref:CCHC-type domain-containing protein n=1 Tax=Mugilogobius chulae TaxID=88201 RepID=A0AAW0PTI1_9GOBI
MAADLCMDKTTEKPTDLDSRCTGENSEEIKEREMVIALKKACATAKKQEEQRRFIKELTVLLELEGESEVSPMTLIRAVKEESGNILACRQISKQKYEVTVTTAKAKEGLLDGFRIGETKVHGRDINTDELVVSFMGLPAYIKDEEIEGKLLFWGVTPVSEVRRRMWPGTTVADGTRFVKVRFTDAVRSLPYSVRFDTAAGPEYFRVIHNQQVRVCRGCLQPDHILRECPDFLCRNCGEQGHYARECDRPRAQKCRDCRMFRHLCICEDDGGSQEVEGQEGEDTMGERAEESESTPQMQCAPAIEPPSTSHLQESVETECGGASGGEGSLNLSHTGSSSTQREGVLIDVTPKAPAGTAKLGRGMGDGTDPHSALEGGRPGAIAQKLSKPEGSNIRGRSTSKEGRRDTRSVSSSVRDKPTVPLTQTEPDVVSEKDLFDAQGISLPCAQTAVEALERRLNDENAAMCDNPVSLQEVQASIAALNSGRSPGVDGLTYMERECRVPPDFARVLRVYKEAFHASSFRLRPYQLDNARSRLISEAKPARAWLIPGW